MSYAFKRDKAWYIGFNDARGRKVQARAIGCTTRAQAEELAVELSIQAKNAAPDDLDELEDSLITELLTFARGFVRASDAMAREWSEGDWRAVLKMVRDMTEDARAAIAKAEGRS